MLLKFLPVITSKELRTTVFVQHVSKKWNCNLTSGLVQRLLLQKVDSFPDSYKEQGGA